MKIIMTMEIYSVMPFSPLCANSPIPLTFFHPGTRWPLNFHFVFDLLAVGSVGLILFSFFLPRSIEKKKDSIESNFQTNDIEPTTIAEDTSEHGSAGTDVSEEERDS